MDYSLLLLSEVDCPSGIAAFVKVADIHLTIGSKQDHSADTLDRCAAACLAKLPSECTGFDWTDDNHCWLFDLNGGYTEQHSMEGVDHYYRKPCGMFGYLIPCTGWTVTIGNHVVC